MTKSRRHVGDLVPDGSIRLLGQFREEPQKMAIYQEAMRNITREMIRKSQKKDDLRQMTRTQTSWEEETRKLELAQRD
jgi:hypothetical protein